MPSCGVLTKRSRVNPWLDEGREQEDARVPIHSGDATESQRDLCQRDVQCTTKRMHPWVWIVVILEIEGVPSVSSDQLEFVV